MAQDGLYKEGYKGSRKRRASAGDVDSGMDAFAKAYGITKDVMKGFQDARNEKDVAALGSDRSSSEVTGIEVVDSSGKVTKTVGYDEKRGASVADITKAYETDDEGKATGLTARKMEKPQYVSKSDTGKSDAVYGTAAEANVGSRAYNFERANKIADIYTKGGDREKGDKIRALGLKRKEQDVTDDRETVRYDYAVKAAERAEKKGLVDDTAAAGEKAYQDGYAQMQLAAQPQVVENMDGTKQTIPGVEITRKMITDLAEKTLNPVQILNEYARANKLDAEKLAGEIAANKVKSTAALKKGPQAFIDLVNESTGDDVDIQVKTDDKGVITLYNKGGVIGTFKNEGLLTGYLEKRNESTAAGIEWMDDVQTKPTEAEVIAARPLVEAAQAQAKVNQKALAYLASTDWYVIRKQETGTEVPVDITASREAARKEVK